MLSLGILADKVQAVAGPCADRLVGTTPMSPLVDVCVKHITDYTSSILRASPESNAAVQLCTSADR